MGMYYFILVIHCTFISLIEWSWWSILVTLLLSVSIILALRVCAKHWTKLSTGYICIRALYEYRERFAIQLISRVPCYRERGRQEAWRVIATSASVPRPPSWSGTAAACDNREVHQLIYCWRHQSSDSGKCVKVGEISAARLIFSGKNFKSFSVRVQGKCLMNSTKRRIVILQLQIMKC